MTLTGDLALRRQQRQLALRAWVLARARFAATGDAEQVAVVQRRIDRLNAPV
jgi:hypothetical protein